ncbi:hypothetical protein LIP24_10335 [Collinsella aerofaciens]|uniref:hypothetical protein n=1 Tax=Collinsella aerofaciens TaxID=74426 RepID=UPI001D00239F|nr:hypothetical protein [Collinsella aerofaciens]MCB5367030.1 hypothetical protein [Collinsella aerofaciens]
MADKKKSLSSSSVLVQLYNNRKLATKVDNMLDEGQTYDYNGHKNCLKEERIGATNRNRFGSLMSVVAYNNATDIEVLFDNGYRTHTTWNAFKRGEVKNVYDRTVYGVGYLGEGPYSSTEKGKRTKQYNAWSAMLNRAYSAKVHKKNTTYQECFVVEEWHNFQTFAKWFDDNYYEIDGDIMNLDKDILLKGNKCYGPNFCVFVPQQINKLFVKADKHRGSQPIGVYYHKTLNVYYASINVNGNYVRKSFSTEDAAFQFYKKTKEAHIQEVAEKYKGRIPDRLYKAMLTYRVDKND